MVAYMQWLGLIPRERLISKEDIKKGDEDVIGADVIKDSENETLVVLKGSGRQVKVSKKDPDAAVFIDSGKKVSESGWEVRIDSPEDRAERWGRRNGKDKAQAPTEAYRAVVYKSRFSGLLQGDLGRSSTFQDKVSDMILQRVPIAVYFGLLSTIIIYSICIPLGIVKAIKHRTFLDNVSSVMVFVGYSIPGFALGRCY